MHEKKDLFYKLETKSVYTKKRISKTNNIFNTDKTIYKCGLISVGIGVNYDLKNLTCEARLKTKPQSLQMHTAHTIDIEILN